MTNIIMDNSCLAAKAECETKAVLRYHWNLVPSRPKVDDAARLAGTAGHAAIAHYFRGGTVDEAMTVLRVMYKTFADTELPATEKRLAWFNVERCMRSWFDQHPLDSLPFIPIAAWVEVEFRVHVAENLVLTGLLDGIVRDKTDGNLYVLETKTTGQKSDWWMKQWRLASQLSQYAYCAQRWVNGDHAGANVPLVHGERIVGVYLNKVDFSNLPSDPKKKCYGANGHGVPFAECGHLHASHVIQRFTRTNDELQAWLRSAYQLAGEWHELKEAVGDDKARVSVVAQQGLFNGGCVFCEFSDFCATGRKNWGMLTEEKWGPVQPVEEGHAA